MKKKGGSVDDRSLYTRSSKEQGQRVSSVKKKKKKKKKKKLFPSPAEGPRNPKRRKNLSRWIRLIQRFTSLRAQKNPSLMRVTSIA